MTPKSFAPEVKRILKEHGCRFVRQAKGSHERWHSPITNKKVTVVSDIPSRHTANDILKRAGIDEKI